MDVFNVAVVGVGNVGKKAYINRLINDVFVKAKRILPNDGECSYFIKVLTNEQKYLNFILHDENQINKRQYDGFIVLFNQTNPNSLLYAINKVAEIMVLENENIVLCCTKMDTEDDQIDNDTLNDLEAFIEEYNIPYVRVSTKTNLNIQMPIEEMAKMLCNDESLIITDNDPIGSPAIDISALIDSHSNCN